MTQPRVIFVIMTYNQAQFVRPAVESALAQDFSPLEILISDDASYDGTWEIIREIADAYEGPHQIRLNRNPKNLSVDHIRHLTNELAGPGFFFLGAGDDVYMPNRVSRLMEIQRETGALAISSAAHKIDASGKRIGEHPPEHIRKLKGDCSIETFIEAKLIPASFGAGLMWHSDLLEIFGPIPDGPRNSDEIMPFRAALLGKAAYTPEALLYWRKHSNNKTLQFRRGKNEVETLLLKEREIQNKMANFTSFIHDTMTLEQRTGATPQLANIRTELAMHLITLNSAHKQLRHDLARRGWGVV